MSESLPLVERGVFLWQVSFALWPSVEHPVSEAVKKVFKSRIDPYLWAVRQNGHIESIKVKCPQITFVIDLEDKYTRWSLEWFPRLYAGQLDADSIKKLALRVYDKDCPDFQDQLVHRDGSFWMSGICSRWLELQSFREELGRDIRQITREELS